jgi:hypothetical protein
MKVEVIPIGFIFLVSLAFIVSAGMVNQGNGLYDNTVFLDEGWNIIPGTIPTDGLADDSDIKLDDISAMWYYSPLQKKYIRVHPDPDWEALQQDDDDFVLTISMWIHVKRAGSIKYSTLEDYPVLNQRQLYDGWNFVSLTPDMVESQDNPDLTFDDIKGSCIVQKQYLFQNGVWVWFDYPEMDSTLNGRSLVVKVQDDCNFELAGNNGEQPPEIPKDINECEDSDGGKNYAEKGTVIDRDANNAVYEDYCLESGTSGPVVKEGNVVREHYCGPKNYQYEYHECPNGCIDGACISGNTGNIQIIEQDFGYLNFTSRLGQSYIEREYNIFPLNQMVQGEAAKYESNIGVNVTVIIIEVRGNKTSFFNKVLNAYQISNWSSQILIPPAYPRMYKLNYNSDSAIEVGLWRSSNYLVIVNGKNIFTDGSDQEEIMEQYFNIYPSTLN